MTRSPGFYAWREGSDPSVFSTPETAMTPAVISLPDGESEPAGDEFEARLAEARRIRRCAECSTDLDHRTVPRSAFCSPRCRYRFRDARKYAEDPEREPERSRSYYWRNREAVLEKAAAKRGTTRAPERTTCEECGDP